MMDFEHTLKLARTVGFASAYSFKYSPRPGTPAAAMLGQVKEEAKAERLAALQALLFDQQRAFNESQIGRTLDVLVAGRGRRQGQAHGRSPYLQAVHFMDDRARDGEIVPVKIIAATQNSLTGRRVHAETGVA